MRARRLRERSEGSHSRSACARISVSPSSPCSQSSARPSVRLSPRAPQRPTAARAGRPRCTRERLAPLAQPLERPRHDGWLSPPRRDRSRGRRARCPAARVTGVRSDTTVVAGTAVSRRLRRRASVLQLGDACGCFHRRGHEVARPRAGCGRGSQRCGSVVERGQQLGLPIVRRSCATANSRPTGRSARVSPRDALVGFTGRDEGVRAGMAATAEGV